MVEKKLITEISDKIKTYFHPQKIILFGSYAWGKPNNDSDIDLFLIMDSNLRRDERAVQVSDLFPDRTFPLDIIVYTPEEVEMSLKRDNPFTREILTKGRVLYEQRL
ncbi:MAG: nucleotidyltransferase domain-containing protein [Elusimicrobiota bacterium]